VLGAVVVEVCYSLVMLRNALQEVIWVDLVFSLQSVAEQSTVEEDAL
jgi:hypothetical protein